MTLGLNVERLWEVHVLVVGDDTAALTPREAASSVLASVLLEMGARVGGVELHASLLEKAVVLVSQRQWGGSLSE